MLGFLNPWLWLGLIAVGAPLWLHLRRREREKIVRFSTLRFLEDQPVARQSPLRLRNILLFLLRLLAVLLVVAAFAQPFTRQGEAPVTRSEVYVLDNTLSRQADGGFQRDRDTLVGAVRSAGVHDQIAVVEMRSTPHVVVGFSDSRPQAEAKLKALEPTEERGSMLAALRQAQTLLQESIGVNKHVTILSDHQANQWTENANAPPFLQQGEVSLSPFSSVASRPNFYIGEPKVERVFLGDTAMIQFTAQLGHTPGVNDATVKMISNGHEIFEHAVNLDDKTTQVGIASRWETDPNVWLAGAVTVEATPDSLPQDNVAYFTVPPITEGKVALLTQSVYVKTALSSAVAKGHWASQVLEPSALAAVLAQPHERDCDVLMIDANYLQLSQGRALMDRYLGDGRGVFIMMGRSSILLTGVLRDLGFQPRLRSQDAPAAPMEPVRYFRAESPVFAPFQIPDFSNLLEVRIADAAPIDATGSKPLLFSQSGDGLVFEGTRDKGRFLLTTFAFDRSQTDWVVHPSFVPFLDSALQYLRPQPSRSAALEPGDVWLIQTAFNSPAVHAILHNLSGQEVARATIENHRATMNVPGQPGLYTVTYDDDPTVQQMLAVNPSMLESDLRYMQTTPDLLKAWTLDAPVKAPEKIARYLGPVAEHASELLVWALVLATLLALLLEMSLLVWRRQAS